MNSTLPIKVSLYLSLMSEKAASADENSQFSLKVLKLSDVNALNCEDPIKGGRMNRSRVRWFSQTKGFGFLDNPEGQDIYVHYTSIRSSTMDGIGEGSVVEYDLMETERGPEAMNVYIVSNPPSLF